MVQMQRNILIGGASHVGKSTLAQELGAILGMDAFSTDKMARHPGRPWPKVPPHVAEFYTALSPESIFTFLLHHHTNMWPGIESFLEKRLHSKDPCILEGSALRPEFLASVSSEYNKAFCLIASDAFIEERIRANSNYVDLDSKTRRLVDVFLARSLQDNAAVIKAAEHHSIECVNTAEPEAIARLTNELAADAPDQ